MALVDRDVLESQPCARIYIAGKLREAKAVEAALTALGLDYFVDIERFERMLFGVIRREYDGVAFYVPLSEAERGRHALRQARLTAGLEGDAGDSPEPAG